MHTGLRSSLHDTIIQTEHIPVGSEYTSEYVYSTIPRLDMQKLSRNISTHMKLRQ